MCKVKTPEVKTPAPAPAPAAPSASVSQAEPENQATSDDALERARRKGRSSLRIPLSMGGMGGGSGVNTPVG